ncbi:alpha-amylase family glycosyl hydrolase [Geofilum sp. OHC36d9]|uniref:alpha-amylase family glycosyl hydrolase n=1 Tax=Geofilum sp. OHC36d9 TaxID=3458413 RepID=UPI004033FB11
MKLTDYDSWLAPFTLQIERRHALFQSRLNEIESRWGSLKKYSTAHQYFGLHPESEGWVFREWAPNATQIYLVGEFSGWQPKTDFRLNRQDHDIWEIRLPKTIFKHGDFYKLWVEWNGGGAMRIPAYTQSVSQDPDTLLFSARVQETKPFQWTDQSFSIGHEPPLIYEAHVGMALETPKVGTYREFTDQLLHRIKDAGYNTVQLMAIQEHPYYGSFGYHVSNFFAPSARFGTPEELKHLVNTAHQMGLAVIMDLVHSHAVKNEEEGLSRFDGSYHQYFHQGSRGNHPAWDSRCFDYGKEEVVRFLLSNCRYWLEEFHFDGFRFDGVTSMLYLHHGLEKDFTGYNDYFDGQEDLDAITYLTLANQLIHQIKPNALSIAEEMSGYPGLTAKPEEQGLGFDYRLSMGVPDYWIKLIKEYSDEKWNVGQLYHEITQHRPEEKVIAYAESHDQALVGDKTIFFRLADKEIYDFMSKSQPSLIIDRAIALHKMIRLLTLSGAYGGYLNFMGNEFGHPEWIDFPRQGNNWSYQHARRQWSLVDDTRLKFKWLGDFDQSMIELAKSHRLLSIPEIYLKWDNQNDQVLAFERDDLLFVFNFNATQSFTGYGIPVAAGKFKLRLSTDDPLFGGFNRIDTNICYYSQAIPLQPNQHQIMLYIPARTALVFERQKIKRVHDV